MSEEWEHDQEEENEGIIASLGENIDDETKTLIGTGGVASLLLLLLL